MRIDFNEINHGSTYREVYDNYVEVFRKVAETPDAVVVDNPPSCWVPLLMYLGASVTAPQQYFDIDSLIVCPVGDYALARDLGRNREYVESICTFRAELMDCLKRSDTRWRTQYRDHKIRPEFVIGSYNSFDCPEVRAFAEQVSAYKKPEGIRNVILSSCTAEKPYPAPQHQGIIESFPDETWHMMTVTGIFGFVPQEIWGGMPNYDGGASNFWRAQEILREYLDRTEYDRIVVYLDVYSKCVMRALEGSKSKARVDYVFPTDGIFDYLYLGDDENIGKLKKVLAS